MLSCPNERETTVVVRLALDVHDFRTVFEGRFVAFDTWRRRCYRFRSRETARKAWVRMRKALASVAWVDADGVAQIGVPGVEMPTGDYRVSPIRMSRTALAWADRVLDERRG